MNAIYDDLIDQATTRGCEGFFDPPSMEINLSDIKPLLIRGLAVALHLAGDQEWQESTLRDLSCAELNDMCKAALLSPSLRLEDRLSVSAAYEALQATQLVEQEAVVAEATRRVALLQALMGEDLFDVGATIPDALEDWFDETVNGHEAGRKGAETSSEPTMPGA